MFTSAASAAAFDLIPSVEAPITVRELDETSLADWKRYVDAHPNSTCYHDLAWRTVAERAYRRPTHYLMAREGVDGRVRGVLPLFLLKGFLRPHLTNGLFGAYATALADTPTIHRALLDRAHELAREHRVPYFVLKTLGEDPFATELGFERMDNWVIAELPLHDCADRMWTSLRDKIRNCVRKAQRAGLEVRSGHDGLAPFYEVLAENMHQKGSPIYGLGFMRSLLEAYGDRADVITLWKGDQAVSGALILRHRDTISVPFASSRPSALAMSPNNLLYWEIIRRGCQDRASKLDFGRSMRDSGPLAFKLGWGARVVEQPCYVRTPSPDTPSFAPDPNQKGVAFFVNQWKRLPRPVVNALGPVICRQVAGLM